MERAEKSQHFDHVRDDTRGRALTVDFGAVMPLRAIAVRGEAGGRNVSMMSAQVNAAML